MKLITSFLAAYRLNARMYNLAIAYIVAALILRFPWLISWVPSSQAAAVFDLADTVTKFAFGLAIWWAKDKLLTGNGSDEKPFKKAQ